MISTTDFRNGLTIMVGPDLFAIVEYQHVKPGKGGAFVRTKLKNLKNHNVIDRTFRAGEQFQEAFIDERQVSFMYHDGTSYHFMDQQSYEQLAMEEATIGESARFLKENMEVAFRLHEGKVVDVRLPNFVELAVRETAPGMKGDTAKAAFKPATLESGATVQVPVFINTGDVVRVDTRTGTYVSRV